MIHPSRASERKSGAHVHNVHNVHNRKTDPTRTLTLRRLFEGRMVKRFVVLKNTITTAIVMQDGFGLRVNAGQFDFPRSADKVGAFMEWLRRQEDQGVLGIRTGTPVSRAAETAWTRIYIESAYRRGIAQAGQNMRRQGVTVTDRWVESAFNRPIHADVVGLLYTRTFQDLKGVTEEMDKQISRVLSQGIIDGLGARAIARQINERVDKIGITRARAIARTEIVRAHSEASISAYKEARIEGVSAEVEFSTAGDDAVCPECEALEGRVFSIDESSGIIPVHVNCRCAWLPVIADPESITLE